MFKPFNLQAMAAFPATSTQSTSLCPHRHFMNFRMRCMMIMTFPVIIIWTNTIMICTTPNLMLTVKRVLYNIHSLNVLLFQWSEQNKRNIETGKQWTHIFTFLVNIKTRDLVDFNIRWFVFPQSTDVWGGKKQIICKQLISMMNISGSYVQKQIW